MPGFLLGEQLRAIRKGNTLSVVYDIPNKDEHIILCDDIPFYMLSSVIKVLTENNPEVNNGTEEENEGTDST